MTETYERELERLWNLVIKNGKSKEKGVMNKLTSEDIETIAATVDFFGGNYQQVISDLSFPKYKVYDWLGMTLFNYDNNRIDIKPTTENDDIRVALANVYLNTSSPQKFVEFLRYMDLEPWIGQFNSEKFVKFVKAWQKEDDDLENGAK